MNYFFRTDPDLFLQWTSIPVCTARVATFEWADRHARTAIFPDLQVPLITSGAAIIAQGDVPRLAFGALNIYERVRRSTALGAATATGCATQRYRLPVIHPIMLSLSLSLLAQASSTIWPPRSTSSRLLAANFCAFSAADQLK